MLSADGEKRIFQRGFSQSSAQGHRAAPNARITMPEADAIGILSTYPLMTLNMIQRVAGWGRPHASTTLNLLHDKALVDKGLIPCPLTREQKLRRCPPNRPKSVWRLTTAGVKRGKKEAIIEEDADVLLPKSCWHGDFIGGVLDIKHRLLIVDTMIGIRTGIDALEDRSIEFIKADFIKERRGKERVRQTRDMITKDRSITPDLITKIWNEKTGRSSMIFVEVQNTRLAPASVNPKTRTITGKLADYTAYLQNKHRRFRDADQALVLYIANETTVQVEGKEIDYLDHIHHSIDWEKVGAVRSLVRLSTFEKISEGFFGEVWRDCDNKKMGLV